MTYKATAGRAQYDTAKSCNSVDDKRNILLFDYGRLSESADPQCWRSSCALGALRWPDAAGLYIGSATSKKRCPHAISHTAILAFNPVDERYNFLLYQFEPDAPDERRSTHVC